MSAAKRRKARRLALLVKMDATRALMMDAGKAKRYWETCMRPLARSLSRDGLGVHAIMHLQFFRHARKANGGRA